MAAPSMAHVRAYQFMQMMGGEFEVRFTAQEVIVVPWSGKKAVTVKKKVVDAVTRNSVQTTECLVCLDPIGMKAYSQCKQCQKYFCGKCIVQHCSFSLESTCPHCRFQWTELVWYRSSKKQT